MDNPETLATEGATRNGQSRDTGNRRGNQKWTIQRHWQPKGQPGMDNPETVATEEATRNGQSRDTGNRRGNQEWTIQRHWQHKIQDEHKQRSKYNTENQQDKQHVFHKRNPSPRKQFLPLIRYQPCYS